MNNFVNYYKLLDSKSVFEEGVQLDINDIESISEEKLFISVCGTIGCGKTSIIKKYLPDYKILDLDETVKELGDGQYFREYFGRGFSSFTEKLNVLLEGNESFIHTGTNANLQATNNRFKKAKENKFTTVLIYVDTLPEIAHSRLQLREERNNISKEKVEMKYEQSLEVFHLLKCKVDFWIHVKN